MGVNYGLNKVRFPAPVPVGSRVRLPRTVASVDDVPGGVQVVVDLSRGARGRRQAGLRRRGRLPLVRVSRRRPMRAAPPDHTTTSVAA